MTGSLARRLGTTDAVVIGLSSMIGAGVFSAFAPAAAAAGSGLLIGLLIAAAVAYCNAVASAQLAAQYPTSGGTYVYGRERLGEWWGFLAGWGFVVGKTASCAAMAITFGAYVVPGSEWGRRAAAARRRRRADSARTCAASRAPRGSRVCSSRLRSSRSRSSSPRSRSATTRPRRTSAVSSRTAVSTACLQAAGLLFFAFAGYARIATLGEEVREPARTIPRAIPVALAIVVVLYLVVGVASLAAAGPGVLAASHAPVAAAVRAAAPPGRCRWCVSGRRSRASARCSR